MFINITIPLFNRHQQKQPENFFKWISYSFRWMDPMFPFERDDIPIVFCWVRLGRFSATGIASSNLELKIGGWKVLCFPTQF